jgi:hypothetical protein
MNYVKIIFDILLIYISVLSTILGLFVLVDKQCWRTEKRSNK